ncbi:MAG: AraC family transcriptional regulator [Rhodobacteraceae bacterium]|nr:AraC family transcriptional regulator [Paracoccaceae bacterium]MAY45608.1 AraC family transcriptional regulator [Paracoccaceae bacterium]
MLRYIAHDPPARAIEVMSLAQLMRDGAWRLELAHDRPDHLVIWITRGQGVGLIDGTRRGLGLHNALLIPARSLFALDLNRQVFGHAVVIPEGAAPSLPQDLHHLRIRDVTAQAELTGLFEAIGREQAGTRPLKQAAMAAHAELMSIWLRRQIDHGADSLPRPTSSHRLCRAYCTRLVSHFASGASLTEHATCLNVTPTHLTRVCKSEIGKTASALLAERLLHAARRLLADTDVPAKDIANHLGFGSAAYFTRFVQQHTQQSPIQLRRGSRTRLQPG